MQDLFKISKGYPGRLNTLKRIKQNDYSLNLVDNSTTYKNWIEIDCNTVDLNDNKVNGIISILCLSNQSFSVDELSKICTLPLEEVQNFIDECSLIEIIGKTVSFISNAHKRYFANLLRSNKKKIEDLLIIYFANLDTINSKYELTKLLSEKSEWQKVVDIIDLNFIQNILSKTGTLQKVNESLELGVQASRQLNNYINIWKYSVQAGIVNELDNYLFWESEIKARIAIHDFIGAISLAESSILIIDRLRLLALVARKQKEFENKVDEELVNLIKELYKSTDIASAGEKIYDIVADLIYAIPNLAIDMIEKASGNVKEKNINDWIVAKLSIAAIDSSLKHDDAIENKKKIEAVENLNNPSVQKINKAISFLVGNYTSHKVLEEVKKLTDANERLRLLRLWLNNNHSHIENIELVIQEALEQLIISSSSSDATLDTLKDISQQLPYVKNMHIRQQIFHRCKSIDKDLHLDSLTKNKYIYDLNMFHVEFLYDGELALKTINKIIKEIDQISDILIKLESYAEVYAKLQSISFSKVNLSPKVKFVYSRILLLSDELFKSTANHFDISQYLIKTISKRNPILALKICEKINSRYRREQSRFLLLDAYLDNNIKYIKIDILKEIELSFELLESKQIAYNRIFDRYAEAKTLPTVVINELSYFFDKIKTISSSITKLICNTLIYKIINKNAVWKNRLSVKYENILYNSWKSIEADWDRLDNGFYICSELAQINNVFSKKIFTECEDLKKNSWIDSSLVAYTYLNSIKIVIRAFSGLIITKNDTEQDYTILKDLIGHIPSDVEKSNLWTEIGINAYIFKNDQLSRKILDNNVLPLLQGLLTKNQDLKSYLNSFVLLHIFNPELALEYISKFANEIQQSAFTSICDFYITQRSPYEIYDDHNHKFPLNYNDISKAIRLIEKLTTDNNVYYQINMITKAIKNDKENELSKVQIADIIEKLSTISNIKFPDNINIKHDGYKLLSCIKIASINKAVKNDSNFWIKLFKDILNIPNISDKLFVMAFYLEEAPFDKISNNIVSKSQVFETIINSLQSLQIHYEFVQRVIDISDIMYSFDRKRWKDIVTKAFTISNDFEDGSKTYNSQKKIIDSMYRLEPAYAKELSKLVNKKDDNKVGKLVSDHFEFLEIANKIKNNENLADKEKQNYRQIIKGIYKNVCELNSNRISSKKIQEATEYLPIANKLPLHEVFPIYMYYLINCSKTYKEKKLDRILNNLHRENFKETVNSTNLIELLSHRKKFNEKSFRNYFIEEDFANNKAIKPGTRQEALEFIKLWIHDEAEDYLFIIDPYFSKEDLSIIKLISDSKSNLEIDILGCIDGQKPNIEVEYKDQWKKITDDQPPFVNITFCWLTDDVNFKLVHDRWLLTKDSGMRLGTSYNSLGLKKESELSIMKSNEALKIKEATIIDFLKKKKKDTNGQRISYKSFTL